MDRLRKKIEDLEERNEMQEKIIYKKNRSILKLKAKIETHAISIKLGGNLIKKLNAEIQRLRNKKYAELEFAESKFKQKDWLWAKT